MIFEIKSNKLGHPYLKKVDRPKRSNEGRGMWISIGRLSDTGIERVITVNAQNGYQAIMDEDGFYRVLILSD